jgi:hypothetical protein
MNRTILPIPPKPADFSKPGDWMDAAYQWMLNAKTRIETDSTVNIAPVAPFLVGTYTAVSTVTGTDALSNFVATFVAALQAKGLSAPNSQRIGS